MLRFLEIGRITHLQMLVSIGQIVDHSESVMILLEDAMTIGRIDLSAQNCVVSIQTHNLLDIIFFVIYVKEKNNDRPKQEPWETPDVTLPQDRCDPLTETARTLLCRASFIYVWVDPLMP